MSIEGFLKFASTLSFEATLEKLCSAIESKGLTIFARIDHAAGAATAGLDLRPTTLVIFGAAKAGTPLMQASQTLAIDLPLKMLVWQDADGKVWIGANDPGWLAARHGASSARPEIVAAMHGLLKALAEAATAS
jgi:uncharacterized protein (DUF302 family)